MRLASDRLPFWSRLVVLALAAATIAAAPLPDSARAVASITVEPACIPLERVEQVSVLVDDMTPDAETLSLTRELDPGRRRGAAAAATASGCAPKASMPALYFQISVLCDDHGPCAIDVSSAAVQDVYLDAMATSSIRAKTWYTGQIILAPRAEVNETRAQRRPRPGRRVRRGRPGGPPPRARRGAADAAGRPRHPLPTETARLRPWRPATDAWPPLPPRLGRGRFGSAERA